MQSLLYGRLVMLLAICVASGDAARILGIAPFQSTSHQTIMLSILKELASRGHQLTVITAMPLKEVPPNYTQITTDIPLETLMGGPIKAFDLGDMSPLVLSLFLWSFGNVLTDLTFKSQNVQKLLHSPNEKFDLIVTELFFTEALLGLSHKYNAPVVGVCTFSGTENIKDAVGDPFPYSYIPNPYLHYSDHMTFLQRLHSSVISFLMNIGHYVYFMPAQDAIMRKHLADVPNLPPLVDIFRNTSLLLLNTHFSHDFSKPKVPNLIEVGGMHVRPPKKLPQDIQKFLDDAKNGVVYFSMGSNLKSSDMSVSKREAFLKAFAKLKQKVMWKFEENLLGVPENVKISRWFPQSDVLGHPNVRLFMTHGGLLSSQEAVYNAVPLIGIPVFGDQKVNVFRAAEMGYAVKLDFDNITEASVDWALKEVIDNPKYKQAAVKTSRIFHDQPETPMERAVFWVEYVLRHNGARHLRSAALDLTWYQYFLLDVVAVLLLSVVIFIVALVWLFKKLARRLLQKSHKKQRDDIKKRN